MFCTLKLEVPPSCIDVCEIASNTILSCVGCVDGNVQLIQCNKTKAKAKFKTLWNKIHKKSVRKIKFASLGCSQEGINSVFTVTENRALTQFDLESGAKVRCVRECHSDPPYSLCTDTAPKGIVITADETGFIRSWDWRIKDANIWEIHDCEEYITNLHCTYDGGTLLATGGDATLMAYDWRQRKLIVKSEAMHSELLDSCQTCHNSLTICSGADGYLEVFKNKEFGNIIERIEAGHSGETIDNILSLRPNIICTSSVFQDDIRLIHVRPNKDAGVLGTMEGGVHDMAIDRNSQQPSWLASVNGDDTLKLWDINETMERVENVFEQMKDLPSRSASKKERKKKFKESLELGNTKPKKKKASQDISFFNDML